MNFRALVITIMVQYRDEDNIGILKWATEGGSLYSSSYTYIFDQSISVINFSFGDSNYFW